MSNHSRRMIAARRSVRGFGRRGGLAAVVLATVGAVSAAGPQQVADPAPQPPPRPTFRIEANYVRVDVYPTVNGEPVRDLTKDDFELLEDGVAQSIDQFEFVEIRGNTPQTSKREPETVAESREMARDPRARVFVLFLDTYHTGIGGSHRMRTALVTLLNRILGPDDLVGVMTPGMTANDVTLARRTETIENLLSKYWNWGRRDQRMDLDPDEELYKTCYPIDTAGVAKVAGDPRTMEQNEQVAGVAQEMIERRREKLTLEALDDLVVHLRGIREERKAVITISDGWRLFRPNTALANVGDDRRPPMPVVGVGPSGRLTNDVAGERYNDPRSKCEMDRLMLSNIDNDSEFKALLSRANRSNVTFYPVDSRGLPVFDTSIEGAIGAPFGTSGVPSPVVDQSRLRQRIDSLQIMAAETDGIAVVNSNDIERGLSRIVADVASYYLLGYYSSNQKLDGRFRAIKVRVRRPGVDVRARRGYLAATEAEMAASAPAAALEVSAEAVALERAIGSLAGLRPDMRVRTQVAWLATPESDGSKGRLWAIAELDRTLARAPEWTAGAKVDATLTTGEGVKLGAAAVELAAGQRGVNIDMPDVALPPGDIVLRMRIVPAAGGLPLVESVRFAVPPAASPVGSPRLWRRGPATGTQFQQTGDAAYRRNEWLRVEVPLAATADSVEAELLDRTGKTLKVPVTAKLSHGDGDLSWAVAELSLAPLAAADYAIRVKVALGGVTRETLLAFRIIP